VRVLLPLALACSGVAPTPGDDDVPDTTARESDVPDLVEVGHRRELRALYVATVYGIDWPSRPGLAPDAQQAEIGALVDAAAGAGLNAIVLQVRAEGDALFAGGIEPLSRQLTGTLGGDPGYDPLAAWLDAAHARGLELHAWLNPYRARAGSTSTAGLVAGHPAHDFPEHAHAYGADLWMDPGADVVRGRVVAVVADLVDRYAVEGVHLDDYFYPYPTDAPFPDDATWGAYVAGGGTLDRGDWRRSNTARLVHEISDAIGGVDPALRFGVSPFGIWRSGHPEGIVGLDAVDALYADPLAWAAAGDVHYLAPQLYWETTRAQQAFGALARWWDDQLPDGVDLFPAHAAYRLGSAPTWTIDELAAQVAVVRDEALDRTAGSFWYDASALVDGAPDLREAMAGWYATPALPPVVASRVGAVEPPPTVSVDGARVTWVPADGRRAVTVYAAEGDGWRLDRIEPAGAGGVTLAAGRWAIASAGPGDVESLGVVVTVP
jgi:uncharacterized lipoprotein YddW (UPF0748 family)